MVRITIDAELVKKLTAADKLVELCDESGRIVGRFVPDDSASREDLPQAIPRLSDEEFEQRCNEPGPWLTTEEFKQQLREHS